MSMHRTLTTEASTADRFCLLPYADHTIFDPVPQGSSSAYSTLMDTIRVLNKGYRLPATSQGPSAKPNSVLCFQQRIPPRR